MHLRIKAHRILAATLPSYSVSDLRVLYKGAISFRATMMTTRKLGQLCGVNIVRIVEPVGVRLRCEFVSTKHPSIEFEISGDLALGIAKEMEMLLPLSTRKRRP